MNSSLARLGKGWGFPVVPNSETRALPWVDGPEAVRQSILILLETEPGERVMRPRFGCGLRRHLMKPNNATTRALIQREVERTLAELEPRILLEGVRVDAGEDPALVLIEIAYVHRRDGRKDNLVYPFYLE